VALGFASYDIMGARVYQSAERKRFDHARQDAATASGVAGATTPPAVAAPVPTDGVSIGEIQIPRLGLRVSGEVGNVVLAGHRDTFLRPLSGVRAGDSITLKTRDGEFEYLVESTSVVAPNRFIVRARQRIETPL
jgi:hypothetical protein